RATGRHIKRGELDILSLYQEAVGNRIVSTTDDGIDVGNLNGRKLDKSAHRNVRDRLHGADTRVRLERSLEANRSSERKRTGIRIDRKGISLDLDRRITIGV